MNGIIRKVWKDYRGRTGEAPETVAKGDSDAKSFPEK